MILFVRYIHQRRHMHFRIGLRFLINRRDDASTGRFPDCPSQQRDRVLENILLIAKVSFLAELFDDYPVIVRKLDIETAYHVPSLAGGVICFRGPRPTFRGVGAAGLIVRLGGVIVVTSNGDDLTKSAIMENVNLMLAVSLKGLSRRHGNTEP